MARKSIGRAEIEARAYAHYEKRGKVPGGEQEDWLRAERELAAESDQSSWESGAAATDHYGPAPGSVPGANGSAHGRSRQRRARAP
jgi:hypothetical protein